MLAIICSSKKNKNKPYLVPYLLLCFSTFGILYLFSIFNTVSIDSVEEVEKNIEDLVNIGFLVNNRFPKPARIKQNNLTYKDVKSDEVVDDDTSKKIWYPGKNISYHDIPNFIQQHLEKNPLNNMSEKLQSMLKIENIQPWKILNLDPEHTLLPFIHIPKTAGSSVKDTINDWGYLNTNWPYKNSLYPRSASSYFGYKKKKHGNPHRQVKSHNSPGCREAPFGGTHCSYSELEECFENNWANLMHDFDDYMYVWRNFYVKYSSGGI